MPAHESYLDITSEKDAPLGQVLGALAVIGAPMLLLQFLLGNPQLSAEAVGDGGLIASLGVIYIGGWMAGIIGMFRQKVYGQTAAAKIVFFIQTFLLFLALMFSLLETIRVGYDSHPVLMITTDTGYPLSHLFMTVTGIFVYRARAWQGVTKLAPFIVGFALPINFAMMPFLGMQVAAILFSIMTATGIAILGYGVFKNTGRR